jgi:hypothetical protein
MEKPTKINLDEITEIELEGKSNFGRGCIDGASIGFLAGVGFVIALGGWPEYGLAYFVAIAFGVFGGGLVGIGGGISGAATGINEKIDFSKLSKSEKIKTVKALLGNQ